MKRYVVGISGASGSILAVKLIRELARLGHSVEIILSPAAKRTLYYELNTFNVLDLVEEPFCIHTHLHAIHAIDSALASGGYPVDGTIIVPCSMATVAALSIGLGDNLLRRVGDVALKERRPLILVPRETPLHAIHLENLLKLAQQGAIILPPMPAWYLKPASLEESENAFVGKILSLLHLESPLIQRWAPHEDTNRQG